MKRSIIGIVAGALLFVAGAPLFAVEFRRAETFEDVFEASCRVSVSGARGSGTFIGAEGNNAYILTNYHVVTNSKTASLDFWTNGTRQTISGRVDWRAYDANLPADFARIVVDSNELKSKIDPPYVALAGADARPGDNAFIISSGAPDGRFTQAWKGQIVEYYNGKTAVFSPPPVPGQSGSGVCEFVDGDLYLVGVLTWLFGAKGQDDSKGGAIPISCLYEVLSRAPEPASFDDLPAVPDDATECVEKTLIAYWFTSEDCPACQEVKRPLEKLVQRGDVVKVATDSKAGLDFAKSLNVNEVPTVVVCLEGKERLRVTYDTMIAYGADTAVINALITVGENLPAEAFNAQKKPVLEDSKGKEEESAEEAPQKEPKKATPATPSQLPSTSTLIDPARVPKFRAPDFRDRPPVRELLFDVGIFADSDARWRQRRKDKEAPAAPKSVAPEIEDEENGADQEEKRGFFDRQKDKAWNGIEERLQGMANDIVEEQTLRLYGMWRAVRLRVFAGVLALAVAASLIARGIVRAFQALANRAGNAWRAAVNDAAEKISATAEKVAAKAKNQKEKTK